jgi:hypothetical protein
MQLHPSLTHQLGLARHHDAEHAAARARRASEALQPAPKPNNARRPRSTAPIGGCAGAARA